MAPNGPWGVSIAAPGCLRTWDARTLDLSPLSRPRPRGLGPYSADRRARGRKRLAVRCCEVADVVRRLRARGRRVTSRELLRVYRKPAYLCDPVVRATFRSAARHQA